MMDRLLVVPLERDLENAEPLVFEKDFVLFRRRGYGVQRRIPARWVRVRTIGCHESLLPELSSCPGAQPIQSGAPSRYEASLQAETLCCLGRVARSRGIDRRSRDDGRAARRRASVTLTPPAERLFAFGRAI